VKKKYRALTALFRAVTFNHIFGQKLLIGIRPSITQDSYIAKRNRGSFPKTLTNADFANHFSGKDTFYFFGTPRISDDYTLVMIDIDVMKAMGQGTTEGAWAFAKHLQTIWPNLYCEPSTNGKGVHGYLFMRKFQVGGEAVNESLDRLAAYLEHQAEKTHADIEMVEVKGYCPIISYNRVGDIISMKSGTFAKYPRKATIQDLQNTTVLGWQELRTVKYEVPQKKKLKCKTGSAHKELAQEYIDQLPKLRKFWASFAPPITADGGRRHVTYEDGAVFLCLTKFLTDNPFKDNRLSVRTLLAYWQGLYDAGHTDRSPNHHIIKAIRDHLSSRGLIDWKDHRYQPPSGEGAKDGLCCRWCLTEDFVDIVDTFLLNGERENVDSHYKGTGEYLIPQMKLLREEKRAAYYSWAEDQIDELFGQAA